MKPMKTAAALRAGDTEFLRNEPMEKFIEQIASPIMDEQDEIESLKAQIRARSEAQLDLKRAAKELLDRIDGLQALNFYLFIASQCEALRKALDEIP